MMRDRIKLLIGAGLSAIALAFGSMGLAVADKVETVCNPPTFAQGNNCKIEICHRDNNVKQPWGPKKDSVDVDAADGDTGNDNGNGDHSEHTGNIPSTEAEAQAMKDAQEKWGDIIPPHDNFAGLNWTAEGQAIFNNDCQFVTGGQGGGETPPPTPPVTPPTTTPSGGQGGGQAAAPAPAQVVVTPTGGVGAGSGGASQETNPASIVGLSGSVIALAAGAAWLNRRNMVRG